MLYFYNAFPRDICSTALNSYRHQNRKHMHIKTPKEHISSVQTTIGEGGGRRVTGGWGRGEGYVPLGRKTNRVIV